MLLKERVIINYIRRRAIRGELREHILLAGLPEDMANLERSFTPEQQLLMNVAGRIDIDKQTPSKGATSNPSAHTPHLRPCRRTSLPNR